MLRSLLLLSTSAVPVHRTPETSGSTRTEPRPSPAVAVAVATAGSAPPARERTGLPDPRDPWRTPANEGDPPGSSTFVATGAARIPPSEGAPLETSSIPAGAARPRARSDGEAGRGRGRVTHASRPTGPAISHLPSPRNILARRSRGGCGPGLLASRRPPDPRPPLTREPSGSTRVGRSGSTRNRSAAPFPGTAHLAPPS